jgi:serine/threonine protein kinase
MGGGSLGQGQVLESGVEFAGYRIEALLGRGGMSEVYRASNPRLGNHVAVKLLARELAEDKVFQERFVRESRLAASLNHPNVVPIFDAGESQGLPFIAMRYVDGPDLKQLIARDGPLPLEYATAILAQVAAALDAAHAKGLVHRDVKPGNILIDENSATDGVPHVYLSDFGVAKHSQSHSGLTSTGHFVGTIDYIAPEQIEGKPLDGTTDLYSLGCLLFECLAGVSPFDRDTDVAMIYAHLVDPPPPVSEKRPDLPAALDGVIAKALSKRPEDRYRTCRELVSAVRATYGADTAGFPIGDATVAGSAPVASETVLATSTNGPDGPAAPVPAPPTTLSDEASGVGAPIPAPPTALASGASTSTPPTELGVGGPAAEQTAATGSADPTTGVIDEQPTFFESGVARHRVWPRALVGGVVVLLLAGGAAAAVLMTSSGKTTKTHQTTGGAPGGTDVAGGVVNPTVAGASTGSGTTKTQTRQTTKTATTKRTTSTKTTTGRRRGTNTQTTTTQGNRRRGATTPTTTSSSTNRRRTTTSSGNSGGTTTNRRRR